MLPKNLNSIIEKKDKFIEESRDKLGESVVKAQKELLDRLIKEVIPQLDIEGDIILPTEKNMKIIEIIDQVYEDFNKTTNLKLVKNFATDLAQVGELNQQYYIKVPTIAGQFEKIRNKTDNRMKLMIGLKDGKVQKGGYLDRFIEDRTVRNDLKQMVLKSVSGQTGLKDLQGQIETYISGNDKVEGKLQSYYRQYAYDVYNQYDRAYQLNLGQDLGLKYFVYQGGLIDDSRAFCQFHNNKVWTIDEAKDWVNWKADKDYTDKAGNVILEKGKQEPAIKYKADHEGYDPIVDCGSYNCRHSVTFISYSMAKRLRPDLANENKK